MAKLTAASIQMLNACGFSEISDDYVVHGSTDVRILLSNRAVLDLNAQSEDDRNYSCFDERQYEADKSARAKSLGQNSSEKDIKERE